MYTIYCDMDGVLVDFEKGYEEVTGKPFSEAGEGPEFWEPIHKMGAAFWIKLKWLPDGKELWNYISPYNPTLLSAPSQEESSKIGKRVWKKNNLPDVKMILTPARFKQKYSGENKILIDDMERNHPHVDITNLGEMKKKKLQYKDEISRLEKLQWEYDHEHIHGDDY